ncbi:hypothetical protein CEXT_655591 [Caerostris extrusa]|uniref:non-specific serine/threonine protein kinase n=1 Tax=Caerostris extrusa TaxID=172846 RepID=A0AAV4VPX4_CAEEX|nr:hypothetical protein CEXT_655591 [Caerostris extrusa]
MDYPVSQQINKDNDDFSDKKFRQTLNITIINNFWILKNSFKEIPHIFVTPETLLESHELLDETGLSKAFTEWLMMWLLRVLSQPCATIVHIECKDLFFSLLQLIKFNNTRNFRHCVLHLFKLLPELNDMIDKFIDEDASSLAIQDYFYSDREITSEFAQELDLVSISITFSSPNECEALQEKLPLFLETVITDVSQFLPDQCDNLCKIFCMQIELGGLVLKKELNSIEVAVASLLTTIIEKVNKSETKFTIMTSTLGKMVQVLIEVLLQLAVYIIKTEGRNIAFETNPNVQNSVKISKRERKSDGFVKILPEIKCTKCVKSIQSIVPYFNHYKITENILSAALQHLIDSDPFVRTKFSEIIGLALKPFFDMQQDYNWKQKLEEILIVKLQAALLSSKMSGNVPFQKSVIYSIGEIGKTADGGLLLITIISLLESYMTSIPSVKVVAFSKLKEIAESKQLRMQDLLKKLTRMPFAKQETSLELGSLLRCNYQPVHNELLLHLSTHYHQVFSGLAILAVKSGNVDGNNSMITHSEEMANYLQPKLLDSCLLINLYFQALESLIAIMKIMGSRAITAVRFKLMATLRLTLRFKEGDFPKICCKAWSTFISSIEVTCLGPLLNQIIVALLPLLELEPVAIAEIFNFLIIEKRSYLSDFYHDLYFVPDTPELRQINAVLKDYNESPSSMADFCSLLCHSLKGISHENLEVRLHALGKLKQVLQSNQKAIHDHLHARESVDNLLSHLVAALIGGCRESDSRIKTALGDCFGELGAIDPGRLDMKSARSKETLANFYSSIDDENFAFALIQALVHSFLAAEQSGIQDCSACAIQEVLRFYKCSNELGSSGNHLWKRFPPDIQEILNVLFHSQYKPLENREKNLLQKVKKENPFKLFHACSVIIKYDLNCTLFLLPHLVVYALLDSTEIEKSEICSEITTVLRHSEQSLTMNDLCQLSSQTVFSVVDHLTKWVHHYQSDVSSRTSSRSLGPKLSQDKAFQSVNVCLSSIPQILLAKSSFACQAYARALMHLETFLKQFPDQLENNISFIQKIYTSLDDSDGLLLV